jgi:hypothetical protein
MVVRSESRKDWHKRIEQVLADGCLKAKSLLTPPDAYAGLQLDRRLAGGPVSTFGKYKGGLSNF